MPHQAKIRRSRSIKTRVPVLLFFGMLAILLLLWSHYLKTEKTEKSSSEQISLYVAEVLASYADHIVKENLSLLENFSLSRDVDLTDKSNEAEQKVLSQIFVSSIFTEGVFLFDNNNQMYLAEPQSFEPGQLTIDFSSWNNAYRKKPVVSTAISFNNQKQSRFIVILAPLRDHLGQFIGGVGGIINPLHPKFRSLLSSPHHEVIQGVDLVDDTGLVLTSTEPEHIFQQMYQKIFPRTALHQKESFISTKDGSTITYFPLFAFPWGIMVQQKEKGLISSPEVFQNLVFTSLLVLALGLVFAWGVARSVVRPIQQLEKSCLRISEGDLSLPVKSYSKNDEIAVLAQTLETMRIKIQHWNRELEREVEQRTHDVHKKQKQITALLQKNISVQEEERKRIARELHDDISQNIIVMLLKIDTFPQTEQQPELQAHIKDLHSLAERTLAELHRIMLNLRPSVLDDLGLISAFSWLKENLERQGIRTTLNIEGDEQRLSPEQEITIFRATQEALSNVLRHAQAKNAEINVAFHEKFLHISIRDDGIGFHPEERENLGLAGMRERISLIDGKIEIISQPQQGTSIHLEVPIHEEDTNSDRG